MFKFAFAGIREAFSTQLNFKIHCVAALIVLTVGYLVGIKFSEWAILLLCIGMVLVAELFNTSIEYLVNLVSPEYNELAGKIKDISAGAVLMAAIIASIIGTIILLPKIMIHFI